MFSKPGCERLAPHLYMVSYPPELPREEFLAFMGELEHVLATAERPYAWVADLQHVRGSNARQRKIVAETEKRHAALHAQHHAGAALVVPNRLVRGVVTAIFWLVPPVYPTTMVDSRAEGIRWAAGQLAAKGVVVDVEFIVRKCG